MDGRVVKNVVYGLEWVLCSGNNIGEIIGRPVLERLMKHTALRRDRQNPWGAHYGTEYRDTLTPSVPLRAKTMRRARDHVDQKLMEIIKIA